MGRYLLSLVCFLVIFHGASAISIMRSSQQKDGLSIFGFPAGAAQRNYKQNECQIERLDAVTPTRSIQSEAGLTEFWDETEPQFQCAGVTPVRHIIQEKGLLLPSYTNAPVFIYVLQGRGLHEAVFPGCPETYQSSYESPESRSYKDQHQKVRQIQEGDVLAVPAGITHWIYNNGQSDLVLITIYDTSNPQNQLDQNFRKFFLAGKPQQEAVEGQRGQSQSQYQGSQPGQAVRNILAGFDRQLVAQSFDVDEKLAERMQSEEDDRGIIVRVERELQVIAPSESQEQEEYERRVGGSRGDNFAYQINFCQARLKLNINTPFRADFYNPRAGRISNVNSFNLPILQYLRFSFQKGVLYGNALVSPNWNINAHSICYIARGSGYVQIVNEHGQAVFDGQVREGQIITAPQNYAVVKKASEEGLEWISFKTSDNAQVSQVAGRVSILRSLPEEVIANAYGISREDARKLKYNREESFLFSPLRSQ